MANTNQQKTTKENIPYFPKFQDWNKLDQISSFVQGGYDQAKQMGEQARAVNAQKEKAAQLTAREAKKPGAFVSGAYQKGKIADLQTQLYNIGAFGNLDMKKAIDGKNGKLTQSAIAKAAELGYDYDATNMTISKRKPAAKPAVASQTDAQKPSLLSTIFGALSKPLGTATGVYTTATPTVKTSEEAPLPKGTVEQGTGNDDIAYVDLRGYKAFGVLPTGHAGIISRDAKGDVYYYDYGAKAGKQNLKRLGADKGDGNDYRVQKIGNFKGKSLDEVGNELFKYFDNNEIGLYWGKGNANTLKSYTTGLANDQNRAGYGTLNNNCSTFALNAYNQALGKQDSSSIIDIPRWNHPDSEAMVLKRNAESDKGFQDSLKEYEQSIQEYSNSLKGLTPEERTQAALQRSRTNKAPVTNFMHAGNLSEDKQLQATRNTQGNISNCINTITSFFDPNNTASSNEAFTDNPGFYGFKEISEADRKEGDVAVLFDGNHPYHGTIINGFDSKGNPMLNYSNGSTTYKTNRPISAFSGPGNTHKHTGTKYYRYTGESNTPDFVKRVAYYKRRLQNMFNNG